MKIKKEIRNLMIVGSVTGLCAVLLTVMGNPKNMGFCIACFIRDISGAVRLHSASVVQYMRPEIIGIVLGSFIISLVKGEFRPRGGSSPFLRFILGFFVMVGALSFLGCPLRMVLRLAGGDFNAIVGLLGFIGGIGVGCIFLSRGFSLGRAYKESPIEGGAISGVNLFFLLLLIAFPSVLSFSETGPGSMHAPLFASLLAGLTVGILSQRTRLCMAGGIRDVILLKDFTLFWGSAMIFVFALIANLLLGYFSPGFASQPVSHTAFLWNFLGMLLVGLGSVLLGGCPLRQLVLAGEGNSDSALTVLGLFVGAAFVHNFSLQGNATQSGPTTAGKVSVIVGIAVSLLIAWTNTKGKE